MVEEEKEMNNIEEKIELYCSTVDKFTIDDLHKQFPEYRLNKIYGVVESLLGKRKLIMTKDRKWKYKHEK